jgi:signal transduction histidine kinase
MGQGTGLGLSICFGIVKSHDGEIRVQSEPNEGTTFQVILPVHTQSRQTSRKAATSMK